MTEYMVREDKLPSQGWRVFLRNHACEIAAIEFFVVRTVNFRILICFLVLMHHRWSSRRFAPSRPSDGMPRSSCFPALEPMV